MACELKFDCGCSIYSNDDDSLELIHACTDHKIQLMHDAIANFSKRVKLGSSKVYS